MLENKDRHEITQQIIDIIETHFPESGFPDTVIADEKYIVIMSRMCDESINYKHRNYKEENFKNISIYSKTDLKFIADIKTKHWSYNAVIYNDLIYFATGVYGDYLRGELLCFDILNNKLIKCSDESRPIHWLNLKENLLEVYTFKSTSYYESDKELFQVINPTAELFFDWNNEEFVTFDEDDLEELLNEDSVYSRLEKLKKLIQ